MSDLLPSSGGAILVIGSGPIVIGQACEFDYSGTQAIRALREEGFKVVLLNSNPATIMTDPSVADDVYLKPLTIESIVYILSHHKVTAVLPTMGGQTALNLCTQAYEQGVWEKYNVELIGVDIDAIKITEDREQFSKCMKRISVPIAPSKTANSFFKGKEIVQEFGLPLVIRPSFTLGGFGASIVHNAEDFDRLLKRGLEASPIHQVLIDKALIGWKEYELELIRDKENNVVIIAAVENIDPMGIHTGDSITVVPPLTLPDTTYQKMRNMAIKMVCSIGKFSGGCNVQFAVNPKNEDEIVAVEMNPRVSRSSALASKASGYPIAKIAAKLALGYTLDELKNQITKSTSAFFEPTLDYVVVKIPRWDFNKFEGADRTLGLQMKSVGEVMAIGKCFQEALQKATQSLEVRRNGLGADGKGYRDQNTIMEKLENPSWDRVFVIYDALQMGISVSRIHEVTHIDTWFLRQFEELYYLEKEFQHFRLENVPNSLMWTAKSKGFSDRQIAHIFNCKESQVREKRISQGIERTYRMVDTCSAEFKATTPYYYSTFEITKNTSTSSLPQINYNESVASYNTSKVIILGSGPNRIGQGIEFDYCCVHGILAAKECGYETVMINCNPETVSTDFDIADKLYFEPVFWEYIYDIISYENPMGVIVQLGGQTALKLAEKLHHYGIKILGTSFESLDLAEDRELFSKLLKDNNIPYPKYGVAKTSEQAVDLIDSESLFFPLLVRPSYVLGGQAMKIVINKKDLETQVVEILKNLPGNKILIDHYLDGAVEAEADAICDGENVEIIGIMEHIEPCGIHSGDSNATLPPFNLTSNEIQKIEEYTKKIAKLLNVRGLINVQFAISQGAVYVIEANPRASRTIPFISKAYGQSYVNYAVKVMLEQRSVLDFKFHKNINGFAVKKPIFSFNKFPNVNKKLGPEMKSTGEEILFISSLKDEEFLSLCAHRNMYLYK